MLLMRLFPPEKKRDFFGGLSSVIFQMATLQKLGFRGEELARMAARCFGSMSCWV